MSLFHGLNYRPPYSLLWRILCILACSAYCGQPMAADPLQTQHTDLTTGTHKLSFERRSTLPQWGVSIDNDLLTPSSNDSDYTGGFDIVYSASDLPVGKSDINPLNKLDSLFRVGSGVDINRNYFNLEVGGFGFTPTEISRREPDSGDRPYASLIYVASTRERVLANRHYNLTTRFTLGFLGLDFIESIQSAIHEATDSETAMGWHNQISNGGELTGQYSVSIQKNVDTASSDVQIKKSAGLSVGFITEANYSLGFRVGKLRSPWWSFKPEQSNYSVGAFSGTSTRGGDERYFWFGVAARLRAYNALLQGQFRPSSVKFDARELRPVLLEFWAGWTSSITDELQVGYQLRGHTSEVRQGRADRHVIWGGLTLSRLFN